MWYYVIGFITLIHLIIYLIIPELFNGFIGLYIVRPILLIFLSIAIIIAAKKEKISLWYFNKMRRWNIGNNPFQAGILIGGFQVSMLIFIGLTNGFAMSPYRSSIQGMLINSLFVFSSLFAIELSRSYLIRKGTKRSNNIGFIIILITLFFFFIKLLPEILFMNVIKTPLDAVQFIGENILPLITMGLFASYLVYFGGAVASIGYLGVIQSFEWFSPVLPDIEWLPMAFISTIGPAVGFLIIQSSIKTTVHDTKRRVTRKQMKDPLIKWTGVAIISIMIIFFSYGYFGVKPTVIYSGSMSPSLEVGDIVFVSEKHVESVGEGDIIQFKDEGKLIIHRVHKIVESEGDTVFITKGDANNQPDPNPIYLAQIQGKALGHVPKIGWISIYLKSILQGQFSQAIEGY
jgi:signal peptidase